MKLMIPFSYLKNSFCNSSLDTVIQKILILFLIYKAINNGDKDLLVDSSFIDLI